MSSILKIVGMGFLISVALLQSEPVKSQAIERAPIEFLQGIQSSVIRAIAAQENTVEVTASGSVLTVSRVNSNMNGSTHAGRNNEAAAIAEIVAKAIGSDAGFAGVTTVRVQYVTRDAGGAEAKIVGTVDFRRNSLGVFEIHTP